MYDYGYYDYSPETAGGLLGFTVMYFIFLSVFSVFSIICMWRIFKKAGKGGWEAIIPIYNIIVLIEIAGLPLWYIVLLIIPFANIYAIFKIYIELAHKFGKSTGFGVGMVFLSLIFMAILAFGKDEYQGTTAQVSAGTVAGGSRFCPNCGNTLDAGTVFCANCGTRVE